MFTIHNSFFFLGCLVNYDRCSPAGNPNTMTHCVLLLNIYIMKFQAFLIEEEFERNARKDKSQPPPKRSHAGDGITRVLNHTSESEGGVRRGRHQVATSDDIMESSL